MQFIEDDWGLGRIGGNSTDDLADSLLPMFDFSQSVKGSFPSPPGGVWRFVMHGPDGVDYQNKIVYLEIVKPERVVDDHGDEVDPGHFRVTVTFAERRSKTELTMRSVFRSAAERDEVVTKYHAIEGGNQTLDRLAEQLAAGAAALSGTNTRVLRRPRLNRYSRGRILRGDN